MYIFPTLIFPSDAREHAVAGFVEIDSDKNITKAMYLIMNFKL
jgi:hypothetical protein